MVIGLLIVSIACSGDDSIPATDLRLEIAGKGPAPDSGGVITMEAGRLNFRIHAPGARQVWLYYQPDAGEPRQYSIPSPGADYLYPWTVEAATGGLVYLVARKSSGGLAYSNALRVESGSYQALEQAAKPEQQLRIEVNLPAFELEVYRSNLLLRKFRIGIGVKQWPVPPGSRLAREVVWNPEWAPPNSAWATPALVRQLKARGEVLGRMKIPLGGEILIHGTSRPSDLGRLVSHGCLRMQNRDIRQLGKLLIAETGAHASPAMIRRAEQQHRFTYGVPLPHPVVVVIRYEPSFMRAGKTVQLNDVYGWLLGTQAGSGEVKTAKAAPTRRARIQPAATNRATATAHR